MTDEKKPKLLTVSQLNAIIKSELENNPGLNSIWVTGEIYNLTYHSSGHIYFTLKDNTSSIQAVFFRHANKSLKFRLEEGMSILVYGGITVFDKRGSYQFNVFQAKPEGTGELQKRIEQLKKKLSEEGIFDPSKKKKLPFLPMRIGIVTSPTGAAVRDIIKVALRRYSNIELVIAPAKVQGDNAPESIAFGIETLNRPEYNIDLIIAGRGGGSFEDLMPFNEEIVIRAFYNSRLPIISAVGHQIDHPLCDDAADVAAPTPSAAAEIAIPQKSDLLDEIEYLMMRITRAVATGREMKRSWLTAVTSKKIFRDPYEVINIREMLTEDVENRLAASMKGIIASSKERTLRIPDIYMLENRIITGKKHAFEMKLQAINKLSPLAIMSRGYSIVTDRKNKLIKSVEKIKEGSIIEIKFADGYAGATVNSVVKEK